MSVRGIASLVLVGALGAGMVGALAAWADGESGRDPAPVVVTAVSGPDFARDVLPILQRACFECHSSVKQNGRLRLDSRAGVLKGGKGGPAVVPGDAAGSPLMQRIRGEGDESPMPYERDPLAAGEIATLEAWVAEGAGWPESVVVAGSEREERHWAYAPVRRPEAARVRDEGWVRGAIDRFVLARLEREGLRPSAEAERAVLLRRVSLDLSGLPASVEDIEAFEKDERPDAYERVVDRLLASKGYGEKWARPWLDLARYADTRGYEKDLTWSMWPYRDWVIGALNADMPFDRFTIEQLAGDLLPGATQDQLIATGFNRCTMINEEGGTDPEEQRVNAVMDRTATTASVWLGSTLGCAQCHDHKFDPFSQKDYYRFYAFFNNSPGETVQTDRAEIEVRSHMLTLPDPGRPAREAEIARLREQMMAAAPDGVWALRGLGKRARELADRNTRPPSTQVMKELETARETRVLVRGSFLNPGEPVSAGTPGVLPPLPEGVKADRLALARWLVDPANPLTARVTVNRLWEQYFGRGLVETSEDFGTRGTPASHPELLDWLASELVAREWSLKAVHRLIVTSATYRQASEVGSEGLERDPGNVLLARGPRFRLEGEVIRDQALAAGGLLSGKMGGPSVFPPQPEGVWANPYSGEQYRVSRGEDRYRRSIYAFWKRSSPHPTFTAFDAPQRQVTCTRRGRTNTALQALTTLNDPAFMEAAVGLGARVMRSGARGIEERAAWAFRAVLARAPREEERARLVRLFEAARARYRADGKAAEDVLWNLRSGPPEGLDQAELAAWAAVANVILNLDEALTKG